MKKNLLIIALWLICIWQTGAAIAGASLPVPKGQVILKVSGNIGLTNVGSEAHFDCAMLTDLPQYQHYTGTPWTRQPLHYSGPLMRDLLAYLGADGDRVHVSALNGYEAYIPTRDFVEYDVLLALRHNNEPISIREYGPLWVLYPFDQDSALLSETFRSRAVWQVMKIDVR